MKKIFTFLLMYLILNPFLLNAEQVDTYKKVQEVKPFFGGENNILIDSNFEHSFVTIGARRIHWRLLTNQILYRFRGQIPYLEIAQHERDRVSDVVLTPGAYLQVKGYSIRLENGFGLDADYIYRYQMTVEVEHKLIQNLFWKAGSRYQHYKTSDIFLAYPGLTYYFGDHYVTANYGFSLTSARSDSHWLVAKINLALNRFIRFYSGGAFGQRLFDINPIDASKENGFIIFGGMEFRILDHLKLRAGYSHSQERPNFIKRSIDGGASLTF